MKLWQRFQQRLIQKYNDSLRSSHSQHCKRTCRTVTNIICATCPGNEPFSAEETVQLREGRLQTTVHIEVAIDAMSVYAAVTANIVKAPAEKSLPPHVQFVRELLDKGSIRALIWLDTHDMIADGMTKGRISQTVIRTAQEKGCWNPEHNTRRFPAQPMTGRGIKPTRLLLTSDD